MPVQPIPEGAQTLTPYLVLDDAAGAIDFYRRAFGAEERLRMDGPDGKVAHASMQLGGSQFMLADEFPGSPYRPPKSTGATGVGLYVVDVTVRDTTPPTVTVPGDRTLDATG